MPKLKRISFEETLGKYVLPYKCIGCGSCIVVCPYKCLEYNNEKPFLVKECKSCGICPQTCPKYNISIPELERFIFGRERREDEIFGIYRRLVIAQTKEEEVSKVCQDGGIVTTLLKNTLDEGTIDGAVLSGTSKKEPLRPIPKLAVSIKDIMESAGTRYAYSPNMLVLTKENLKNKKNLAFLGTPCQIQAIRRIQFIPLRKYSKLIAFTIGLFCSECFTYNGLVKDLFYNKLDINSSDVKKVNIKGKMIVTNRLGEETRISLKIAKKFARDCFKFCYDFSSELADISVGGLGLDGWTFVVLRTKKGEDIFKKMESKNLIRTKPVEKESRVLDLTRKLSIKKSLKFF
jgi:coenzyme F420 hydrogenase subunit beta